MNRKTLTISGVIIVLLLIGIVLSKKTSTTPKTNNNSNTRDFETTQTLDTKISPTNSPTQITPVVPTVSNKPLSQDSIKKEITPTPTLIPTQVPTFIPTPTLTPIPTLTPTPTLNPTKIPTATPTINNTVYPTGVSLSATLANLYPGDQQQIVAKVEPDNASNKNVTWSSNDSRVAIVDSNGLITAINSGVTNIIAKTSNNKTTIIKVVISPIETPIPTINRIEPDSINLNLNNVLLSPNKRQQIIVNFTPQNTNVKTITWSSNNSEVVTVTNSGLVTSLKSGTALITARTSNGKTATAKITVSGTSNITPTRIVTSILTPTKTNTPTQTPTSTPTPKPADYFTAGLNSYVYRNGNTKMNYWLYVPKNALKTQKMPLLIFLHGSGEAGDNINSLMHTGTIPYYLKNGYEYNAFILAPQSDGSWSNKYKVAKQVIDKIVTDYNIDTSRISITGHSYGGGGTWLLTRDYPNFFSCSVPVSAVSPSTSWATKLLTTKIWAWHGTADTSTSPSVNKRLVDAITKAGGDAKITLLEGKKHGITKIVYIDNDMVNWMIKQKR